MEYQGETRAKGCYIGGIQNYIQKGSKGFISKGLALIITGSVMGCVTTKDFMEYLQNNTVEYNCDNPLEDIEKLYCYNRYGGGDSGNGASGGDSGGDSSDGDGDGDNGPSGGGGSSGGDGAGAR